MAKHGPFTIERAETLLLTALADLDALMAEGGALQGDDGVAVAAAFVSQAIETLNPGRFRQEGTASP